MRGSYPLHGRTAARTGSAPPCPAAPPDLNDVDMVEVLPTVGYAVGDGGAILKTVDAGLNWSAQTSNTTEDLYAVTFAGDGLNGVAVGRRRHCRDDDRRRHDVDGRPVVVQQRPARRRLVRRRRALDRRDRRRDPLGLQPQPARPSPASRPTRATARSRSRWTNPATDFGGVMVYYSTVRCASSVYDTFGQEVAFENTTGTSLTRTGRRTTSSTTSRSS